MTHDWILDVLADLREFASKNELLATEEQIGQTLATVERELALGETQRVEHERRLASLGVDDDEAFARAIRAGDLDDRLDEVRAILRADVDARLAVANPGYAD